MSYLSPAEEELIEIPEGRTAWLSLVIAASRSAVDQFCSRQFDLQTRTETYDGTGSHTIGVRQWPITAVSAVTIGETAIDLSYISFEGRFISYSAGLFTRGVGNIEITYEAGYASVPKEVIFAQIQTAQAMMNGTMIDPNTLGESTSGYSASFAPEGAGSIPRVAQSYLRPFLSKFAT